MSPKVPVYLSLCLLPKASQLSSISHIPLSDAKSLIFSIFYVNKPLFPAWRKQEVFTRSNLHNENSFSLCRNNTKPIFFSTTICRYISQKCCVHDCAINLPNEATTIQENMPLNTRENEIPHVRYFPVRITNEPCDYLIDGISRGESYRTSHVLYTVCRQILSEINPDISLR